MRTDKGPTGPQCQVLRWMRYKQLTADPAGWGTVGGQTVSERTLDALIRGGWVTSADGGNTYQLTTAGRKWANDTGGKS